MSICLMGNIGHLKPPTSLIFPVTFQEEGVDVLESCTSGMLMVTKTSNKLMSVFHASDQSSVIDHAFRDNIPKVAVDPQGDH